VEALKKKGHECVELKLPNMKRVMLILFAIMFAEGKMSSFFGLLKGEPLLQEYSLVRKMVMLLNWSRKFAMTILILLGEKRVAELVGVVGEKMAYDSLE